MTWTGKTFSVGALLPAVDLNNLSADIIAAFAGDSGAPTLVAAAMAADAVLRAKIKTTTVSLAGSISTGTYLDVTLNPYSFFPMIHSSIGAEVSRAAVRSHITDGASADNPRFSLYNANGNSITYDIDYRYILAS